MAAVEQSIEAKLALGRHAEVIGRAGAARRRAPVQGAAARAADARALPRRPPGGRPPGLPGRAPGAGRGARASSPASGCGSSRRRCWRRTPAGGAGAGSRARAGHRGAEAAPAAAPADAPERGRDVPDDRHRALVGAVGGGCGRDGGVARPARRADRARRRGARRPAPEDEGGGRLDPQRVPARVRRARVRGRPARVAGRRDVARRPRPACARGPPHRRGARARRRLLRPRAQQGRPRCAGSRTAARRCSRRPPGSWCTTGSRPAPSSWTWARTSCATCRARSGCSSCALQERCALAAGRAAKDPQDRHGPVRGLSRRARTRSWTPRRAGGSARRRSPARARCSSVMGPRVDDYPGDVVMAVFGVPAAARGRRAARGAGGGRAAPHASGPHAHRRGDRRGDRRARGPGALRSRRATR